jgi:hypothetical protein
MKGIIEDEFQDFVRQVTDGFEPPTPNQLIQWRWLFFAGWRSALACIHPGMTDATYDRILAEIDAHKREIDRLASAEAGRLN